MSAVPLQLACASDASYLPHVATLIESLGASNALDTATLHLLHDDSISAKDRQTLTVAARDHGLTVNFIRPTRERVDSAPAAGSYAPIIWYRIWLPELLESVDRVLYLDADTLVLQDLRPLWNTSLGDALLAAVAQPPDMHGEARLTRLGRKLPVPYFNSGVLLMNLAQMRAESLSSLLTKLGHELAEDVRCAPWERALFPYPDQDAFNLASDGRWLRLHPRWNCFASLLLSGRGERRAVEFDEATASPAVLHFEGSIFARPWNYRCVHPHRHLYLAYRNRTPWPLAALEGAGVKERALSVLPMRQQHALALLKRRLTGTGA